jgi:ABC-type dipeptide/oligopeptide/nickel transport system ATPase component
MIKVNNLSKEFHEQGTSNELLAVDHVDFTIQNGSFCALVGESGQPCDLKAEFERIKNEVEAVMD